ncbi:MAG: DUF3971 domain-containing protein [Hyphomonadaceae bacterium]|nr:DUF3971 domain-containing protein [Hyphomonadaceae bacterium]
MVEIVLGLVAAIAIGAGIAWWRLSQGPIELGFLRAQMQQEFSAAREGRPVGLDRVELAWAPRGALELRAVDVTFEDGRGGVLSRSDEARIEVSVLPLLVGRIRLERAEFTGGALTFTRRIDGAVHVAFGPEGAPPDIIIPPPPPNETLEQRVVRILDSMAATFRPVGAGGGLRGLSVRDADLTIIDQGGGGRWTAHGANFELERSGRSLELAANALLEGADGAAPANLRITTDTRFSAAIVEFGAENVQPRALLSPAALGPFAGLDAPLSATVSIGLDRRAGVNRFEGEAVLGRGSVEMAGERVSIDGGRFSGRYDVASDELIIDELALGGDRTRIRGELRVRDVSAILRAAPNEPANFSIALPSMTLEVPSAFPRPVSLAQVDIAGAIVSAERSIRFSRIRARIGDGVLDATGRLYWGEAGDERRLHPGVELVGAVTGPVDATAAIAMWPIGLGEAARSYVARALEAGRVTDTQVRLDIRPQDVAAGVYRQEAVDVHFNVEGGVFRFVQTMSPVTDVRGSAVLRGNSFVLNAPNARINNLTVADARLELPRLKPRGAMATITARVDGDARNLLELLAQEPIGMRESIPVDIASASGRGSFNLTIQRPMLSEVPREDWRFRVDGAIRDFAGNMSTRRVAVSQGQLSVRGDQRAVTVSGPIRAGESRLEQVRWTETLSRGARAGYSEYTIAGDFDANDLERLGYAIARHARGRIGVTVTGRGRGFDVDNARVDLDLTAAAVESPWSFWTKRAGAPASARFAVERQRDGGLAFTDIDARGAGLLAQGRVVLARDQRIVEADFPRLVIEGRSDARVNAVRAADGGLDVAVRGALFDAAPFMDSEAGQAAQPQTAASVAPPLRATVIVDRLKMRGDATLSDARVTMSTQRGALATLIVDGRTPGNGGFSLALGPRSEDPQGRIRFRSDNAGFAVAALTGSENVVGGRASADGVWRLGPPSSATFSVRMEGFEVVRLPAMARLLSSAGSLTGLVEMLNGDGIGFSVMEAQMAYANDRLSFTEGSMRGPSLGLTASGAYNIERNDLDVDGVVAPSPTLNLSMLGEIPLLGNLIVSRRGEGVFGMTYSINGPAESPRVGVNPVSALTPGILRRIFEPIPERQPQATPPEQPAAGGQQGALAPAEREQAALP